MPRGRPAPLTARHARAQAVPLRLKEPGAAKAPLYVPWNPNVWLPPGEMLALCVRPLAVTAPEDSVRARLQPSTGAEPVLATATF